MPACTKVFLRIFIVFGILTLASTWLRLPGKEARADDENEYTVKTEKNLRFNVPKDWPIEERNGVVGPIPIEKYLSLKFADIRSQLASVNQQINLLDARLQKVERQVKQKKELASPSASH